MTDALGPVNDCYVGRVLDDGHLELLKEPTESYEVFEEKE